MEHQENAPGSGSWGRGLTITVLSDSHKKGEDVVSDQVGVKMDMRKREDVDSENKSFWPISSQFP